MKDYFGLDSDILTYAVHICISCDNGKTLLQMAHNALISGHVTYAETFAGLEAYTWLNRSKDI